MEEEYAGWLVAGAVGASDLFQSFAGVDAEASTHAYIDVLTERFQAEWPGIEVRIRYAGLGQALGWHSRIHVYGPPISGHSSPAERARQWEEAARMEERAQEIAQSVWEAGDWAVLE